MPRGGSIRRIGRRPTICGGWSLVRVQWGAARHRGFSLVELLVVLVLLLLLAVLSFPSLHKMILRSRLQGHAGEAVSLLEAARLESIRHSRPVVVELANGARGLFAFIDQDHDLTYDPGLDVEVGRRTLPGGLTYGGPADASDPADRAAVQGFTVAGPGGAVAVFEPDGSVRDSGAFRLADARGNYLEIRIEPAATGRVRVRKWQERTAGGFSWVGPGDIGHPWRWRT